MREAKDLPSAESTNFFQCLGVKYLIFHQDEIPPDRWQDLQTRLAGISLLHPAADFGADHVYELAAVPTTSGIDFVPSLDLPSAAIAGSTYRGFLEWQDPGESVASVNPRTHALQATWIDSSARRITQSTSVQEPGCFRRGWNAAPFDLAAPDRPSTYQLELSADGKTTTAPITIAPPASGANVDDPRPALQLVGGNLLSPAIQPGGVVFARTTWRLRHATLDNYLLSLEVVGSQGQVIGSSTIDPFDGDFETGRWLPGETVEVGLSALIAPTAAPGDYTVRVSVRYADGVLWKLAGPDNNDHDRLDLGPVKAE
jgi:hypothetical protein